MKLLSEKLGVIRYNGPKCRVCDTSMFFDTYVDTALNPGEYEALHLKTDAGKVIGSAIRLRDAVPNQFDSMQELSFDFAQFGYFDLPSSENAFEGLGDMNLYYDQLNHSMQFFWIDLGKQLRIPAFRCENGMGRIECERQDDKQVGIRVIYIDDEVN